MKATVLCNIARTVSTRASGSATSVKKKAMSATQTAIDMKVTSKMAKLTAKESTIGPMAKFTTANGAGASRTATGCGGVSSEIAIWGSGKTVRHMAMEFISGKMVIGMKDLGRTV